MRLAKLGFQFADSAVLRCAVLADLPIKILSLAKSSFLLAERCRGPERLPFKFTTPAVPDENEFLGGYNEYDTIPMLIFVDANTMKILNKVYGYGKDEVEGLLSTYTQ